MVAQLRKIFDKKAKNENILQSSSVGIHSPLTPFQASRSVIFLFNPWFLV